MCSFIIISTPFQCYFWLLSEYIISVISDHLIFIPRILMLSLFIFWIVLWLLSAWYSKYRIISWISSVNFFTFSFVVAFYVEILSTSGQLKSVTHWRPNVWLWFSLSSFLRVSVVISLCRLYRSFTASEIISDCRPWKFRTSLFRNHFSADLN